MTLRLPRICTSLLAASAVALALPAAAIAQEPAGSSSGGAQPFAGGPTAPVVAGGLFRGTVRWSGSLPGAQTARIERLDPATGAWSAVTTAPVAEDGTFAAAWRGDQLGSWTVRAVDDAPGAEARAADAPPTTQATVFRGVRATWYGPGFYGKRTACGGRLSRSTVGVAHRRLPCGTKVAIFYRGRALTVPVIDRGPFANGAHYDLTYATAKALGFKQTATVGVAPQR